MSRGMKKGQMTKKVKDQIRRQKEEKEQHLKTIMEVEYPSEVL